MPTSTIATILIVITNLILTYKGFHNLAFFNKYKFNIEKILLGKQYIRLISSGFLHVNWIHFIFNMYSLYIFSEALELTLGAPLYMLIYFSALVGGNLFALVIHKNEHYYTAVGASGAVCGIIFACIAIFPSIEIGFLLLPINIPGWIYGLAFVAYSLYGMRTQKDNIGHDAHLAGALTGMFLAALVKPEILQYNYTAILLITIPSLVLVYIIIAKPHVLYVTNPFAKQNLKNYTIDHKYNAQKQKQQQEMDKILDKIRNKGIHKLTEKERKKLDKLSK